MTTLPSVQFRRAPFRAPCPRPRRHERRDSGLNASPDRQPVVTVRSNGQRSNKRPPRRRRIRPRPPCRGKPSRPTRARPAAGGHRPSPKPLGALRPAVETLSRLTDDHAVLAQIGGGGGFFAAPRAPARPMAGRAAGPRSISNPLPSWSLQRSLRLPGTRPAAPAPSADSPTASWSMPRAFLKKVATQTSDQGLAAARLAAHDFRETRTLAPAFAPLAVAKSFAGPPGKALPRPSRAGPRADRRHASPRGTLQDQVRLRLPGFGRHRLGGPRRRLDDRSRKPHRQPRHRPAGAPPRRPRAPLAAHDARRGRQIRLLD